MYFFEVSDLNSLFGFSDLMGAGYFIGFLWFQFVNFVAFILEKLKLRVKVPSLTDDLTCVSALSLAKKIRLKEVSLCQEFLVVS